MKRFFFILLVVAVSAFNGYSQSNSLDVVHLKNGSIIRGIIIEQVPNQSIKIQTRDGNIFVYKIEEVEKITKDLDSRNTGHYNNSAFRESKIFDLKGYRGSVDIGYIFGLNSRDFYAYEGKRLEISTTQGYQVNNHFFTGVGAGIHYNTGGGSFMLPMFINLKGYLLPSEVTPYVDFRGGYTMILSQLVDEDIAGGIYISPAIGVRYLVSDKIGITASVGFVYQQIRDTFLSESMALNGISLKFGVEF